MDFINEDDIAKWVYKNNGVVHTRKISNINSIDFSQCLKNTLVCLTGYDNIIQSFFQNKIPLLNEPIILITIETDGFTIPPSLLNHPLITHWFTWNKPFDHPKFTCIPEGLNYDRQQVILSRYLNKYGIQNTQTRKLLCFNSSNTTHSIRNFLYNKAQNEWKDFCDILENIPFLQEYIQPSYTDGQIKISVTHPKCYSQLSSYKFILSPQGAGLDCHRTWEALYLNIIPIVLSSSIDELYEDLPVVIVNDWNKISEAFLFKKFLEINTKKENNEYNMNKLSLTYWINKIENLRHS